MASTLPFPECRLPEPGAIVHVRQRLYLVEQIIAPINPGDGTIVRLSCVDDDAQGQALEVLWEHELDAEIRSSEAWNKLAERGFDPPDRFAAYLNTMRWNCVTSTDPRLFQSPFRAGIRLDPYQLEPLRKALRLPRVNLFIADDVGLGKTIEAGLIARELLLRKKVREIVVSCPPSMLLQWQEELSSRFGLQFEILDKEYVRRVRRERGFSVNPWTTHSRFLISHRLLIDESYTAGLRDWLSDSERGFRPATLFVLDEAHHAAPASGQKYAIDSQITIAVRNLAPCFEHRLFLSATPHNGHSNSFSALLEILDPQRFCRGVPVTTQTRDDVMVRRIKEDLRVIQGGFPRRHIEQVNIDGLSLDAPELRLFSMLSEYQQAREQRLASESKRTQATSGLLLCHLQQRLFSSIDAFARTLRVHRKTVERRRQANVPAAAARINEPLLFRGVGPDDDRAALRDAELSAEVDAQIEAATNAIPAPTDEAEHRLLADMTSLAEASRNLSDARVLHLTAWLRDNLCPGGEWSESRVIIFTEYEDTLRYLEQQIRSAIASTTHSENRIAIYRGSTPTEEREDIKRAFNADPAKHPVRILIATDAAREGLNLQAHCNQLFHFDVPWNPSRMEQRNGRIDRKLQPASDVFCYYFVYAQRPEDRILEALVRKTKLIREQLGSLSQVIDDQLENLLKHGIARNKVEAIESMIDLAQLDPDKQQAIVDELESTRERQDGLRESIEQLRTMMERSRREVGLDEERFRSAISCALQMLHAEPLRPVSEGDDGPRRFILPRLDDRESSWAETMDTLRYPKPRDEKLLEWRRSSPVRAVVFEDPGKVTDEIVQLHLEQRVVQRLLARFLTQGFVHHDLSRACLAQSQDAIPRVILLGRLALYGPGAARLHEDIVAITARWTDSAIRKTPLQPYARESELKTLDLLDRSLLSKGRPTDVIERQLIDSAPRDISELLPYLEERGQQYAEEAIAKLSKRGDDEAKQMLSILESQRKHILAKEESIRQRTFEDWVHDEKRQLDADRRNWQKRLVGLEAEVETEPARIREVYQVRARRIEPVGLVYLWPVTN